MTKRRDVTPGTRLVVMHAGYGCETGCCGHVINLATDPDGNTGHIAEAYWEHPDGDDDLREWAEDLLSDELGPEHVADLDWENSLVVNDCDMT